MRYSLALIGIATAVLSIPNTARCTPPAPPDITSIQRNGQQIQLEWTPYPAAEGYRILKAPSPEDPFVEDPLGLRTGFQWTGTSGSPTGFYKVVVDPLSDAALLTANALNRLAYGPTPDELERILTGPNPIGPDAYIAEQLAPETLPDTLNTEPPYTGWTFVSATGTAAAGRLYFYLDGPGQVYIDDATLVKGTEAGVGANLLVNGSFESPLSTGWTGVSNFVNSVQSSDRARTGTKSLLLVGTGAGTGSGNSLVQTFSGFQAGQVYTLGFWYLPTNQNVTVICRLSGTDTARGAAPVTPTAPPIADAYSKLSQNQAGLGVLRSWLVGRAVRSRSQLLEVLTQFFENHFVTEHSKTVDYLDRFYDDFTLMDKLAAGLEFREISRWRTAMLKPDCTFKDLLTVSAESPAQIIYLDTVDSRGDGSNIANENYSRELLELYTFGVDNGYDQSDIVTMSRAWTGWSVRLVDPAQISNPFAPQSTNKLDATLTNQVALTSVSNLVGVWTFGYRTNRHNNKEKIIFPNKTVPARFGAPWAGRNYQLKLAARANAAGINDGYDVINHLADQPFTQEFISVKLCRLLVHENFQHGVYDYRDPNLSEEGQLVHNCMLAWENGSPKGQLRKVLKVIFDSELFRKHGGSMQKVKTPLEFCVSAIRALRADLGNGKFSASTDGYSIVGRSTTASTSPLIRMGVMKLFDRMEPDGFPEAGAGWISGGTLAERAHFIQAFLMNPTDPEKDDGMSTGNLNLCDPVALIKAKLPSLQWKDPQAVASYFLKILFPAEGSGNLSEYLTTATAFLNIAEDGKTPSPFNLLNPGTAAYDTRVRGMVSVLMLSPRFQEQ